MAAESDRRVDRTKETQAEYAERIRLGLDALAQIGTEEERRQTMEDLMAALAATRREEGRPF